MVPTGASIAPAKTPRKRQRHGNTAPIIAVHRREGLRYIVRDDPCVTAFETLEGAVWLVNFLG